MKIRALKLIIKSIVGLNFPSYSIELTLEKTLDIMYNLLRLCQGKSLNSKRLFYYQDKFLDLGQPGLSQVHPSPGELCERCLLFSIMDKMRNMILCFLITGSISCHREGKATTLQQLQEFSRVGERLCSGVYKYSLTNSI